MYEASAAGEVKYANLKIAYKQEYDTMDKEDVVFIYKQFFEETIVLLKKKDGFETEKFLKEEIEGVLAKEEPKYALWAQQQLN